MKVNWFAGSTERQNKMSLAALRRMEEELGEAHQATRRTPYN